MKILIVGGNGTIGKKVAAHLNKKHEIVIAGRKNADVEVNIRDISSIQRMFEAVPLIDAVVCTAGEAKWDNFNDLSEEDFYIGIKSKMMGQVNLVRIGKDFINSGGSFTLTTGILADDPVAKTSSAALVNGALHSFVKAVSLEIDNDIRVNAVAPGLVEDAYERYKGFFPGYNAIPMDKVINGYVRSVEGKVRGEVIRIYD
jgi:NAD(P)-dependent dehydrogenase (short-subunit alcohol dehydrogenase family)